MSAKEDLFYKIDSEGFSYFFTQYGYEDVCQEALTEKEMTKLKVIVEKYQRAQKELESYLEEIGVTDIDYV